MAISRFEQVDVNTLTFSTNDYGEGVTTITKWFSSRPLVGEVKASVAISERYRVYQDLISMKFNYTPNMQTISNNQNLYSITYRGNEWRIADCLEANDRMSVTLMCYRSDPTTEV